MVFKNDARKLIVYIPENIVFELVNIEAGAGEIKIEDLETKKLSFEIGAGKVEIAKLNVLEEAKIDGGAGKVEILSGNINNLKLNVDVGEFILNDTLTGNNDIEAGIGKLEIDLKDELENYEIKVNKGIGSITIDGKEVSDNTKYGDGKTSIKVDGGIGSIIIK